VNLNLTEHDINEIISLITDCGEYAKKCFLSKDFQIYSKKDNSKVTSVDLEISNKIYDFLHKKYPNISIICEEQKSKNTDNNSFFLIDPIDGTSSFINNNHEFCINIAYIENLTPVFGVIYAPLFEGGKLIYNDQNNKINLLNLSNNHNKIITKTPFIDEKLKIIISPRTNIEDVNKLISDLYPQYLNNYSIQKLASAVKFFKLFENEANLYIHLKPTMEWDIASGNALIRSLGFDIFNLEYTNNKYYIGNKLKYKKSEFLNNKILVSTF
jgi:3'(2'), 5'-bisphosphate nucleotidase